MQSNLHQLKYTHNIMKFKQVKLSEVANIFAGYPFKGNNYSDKGVRVVRGDNVTIGHLRWTIGKDKRWNEPFDQFEYYSLHENDIVIGMDGSRVGMNRAQIKHEDLPLLLAQRVACIRNNSNSIQDYLYYQIFSNNFVRYIKAIHTGTSIPHVSLKQIGDFAIPLPSLSDQRRIAGILSALDSKIENNNKINANLESQAQALFKSWFVDFTPFKDQPFVDSELGPIPQGWKVGTLFDVANLHDRYRRPLSSNQRSLMAKKYPYYGATSLMDFVEDYIFDGEYVLMGEDGSVVTEKGYPFIQYVWGKIWVNNHAHVLSGKDGFPTELLIPFLKTYNIKGLVTGAVQAKLNQANMAQIQIPIPPKENINNISVIIKSIYKKYRLLTEENQRLAALRDTLLPKLMSGEIKL